MGSEMSIPHASHSDLTTHISSAIIRPNRFMMNNKEVPQGPATDAGGTDFNIPASIWLFFSLAVGIPMSLAGFRGWRLSTGVGVGLAATITSWATLINAIPPRTVDSSDIVISGVVMGFFVCGFVFGVLELGRITGTLLLGVTGGLAIGIRVMILKSNLLLSGSRLFSLNWVLVVFCGIAGGVSLMWKKAERKALLLGCTSIGTFLTFLGIDLIINKQGGMSRGLRILFDRNPSHVSDIIEVGYHPPPSTQILIGVSLVATPILALSQHYLFKEPFRRRRPEDMGIVGDLPEKDDGDRISGRLQKGRNYDI